MEGVGRISLALATLTEDPGEEDRIDEGDQSINQSIDRLINQSININTSERRIVLMKVINQSINQFQYQNHGEEDRIDEGNLFSFYCTHVLYQKRTKDDPGNKFSFFVL